MRCLVAVLAIAVVASLAAAYSFTVYSTTNCTGFGRTASLPDACTAVTSTVDGRVLSYQSTTCGSTLTIRTFNTSDTTCAGAPIAVPTSVPVGVCLPSFATSTIYTCSASSVAAAVVVVIVASVAAVLL
jgi:hypothetical protein